MAEEIAKAENLERKKNAFDKEDGEGQPITDDKILQKKKPKRQ